MLLTLTPKSGGFTDLILIVICLNTTGCGDKIQDTDQRNEEKRGDKSFVILPMGKGYEQI
jgi:hypothetical protein